MLHENASNFTDSIGYGPDCFFHKFVQGDIPSFSNMVADLIWSDQILVPPSAVHNDHESIFDQISLHKPVLTAFKELIVNLQFQQ